MTDVEENLALIKQLGRHITNDRVYYVKTDAEFDAVLTDIQTNNYMAVVHIMADLTNVQAVFNDASAGLIINGHGHTLDCNGDNNILTITNCKHFECFGAKFDQNDQTDNNDYAIEVSAFVDQCFIHHNFVHGDGTHGRGFKVPSKGIIIGNLIENISYGIYLNAYYSPVIGNTIFGVTRGIYISGILCPVFGNIVYAGTNGIYVNGGDYTVVSGNTTYLNDIGIMIDTDANENVITGNLCYNNTTYGIRVDQADCDENTVSINHCKGNGTNYSDVGTNTDANHNHV